MVPETHSLSSPVGDSWESTHPCNDHLELESKNKISKKGYLIVVGSQVGNLLEELTGYPIVLGAQVGILGDIPYACVCWTVGFVVDVWMVFSTVIGPIL